jgi:non-homologous end joining protein Ku
MDGISQTLSRDRPIQLFNATTLSETVSFHFIHPKTRNRVRMEPFDPGLGQVDRK